MSHGLLNLVHLLIDDAISDQNLIGRLKAAVKWAEENQTKEPKKTSKRKAPTDPTSEEIERVFSYWQTKTNRPKAKRTVGRIKRIRARLKDGFSVEDLCRVIDFAVQSDFHQGDNENGTRYDWTRNIMGSTEKVEKNLEKVSSKTLQPQSTEKPTDEIENRMMQALQEGRNDEYNALRAQLEDIQKSSKVNS